MGFFLSQKLCLFRCKQEGKILLSNHDSYRKCEKQNVEDHISLYLYEKFEEDKKYSHRNYYLRSNPCSDTDPDRILPRDADPGGVICKIWVKSKNI